MNKQNNMKGRQRGRNNNKQRQQNRNSNFDGGNSNRMRGNAHQLMDKYLSMARDAASAGDRVLAENYYQHADHYYRVVNARMEQQGARRGNNEDRQSHGNGHSASEGQDEQPQSQMGNGPLNQDPVAEQPQFAQGAAAEMPADKPSPSSHADIGLPPGILGMEADADSAGEEGDSQDDGEKGKGNGARQSRPRQQGRRRRSRTDRAAAAAGE